MKKRIRLFCLLLTLGLLTACTSLTLSSNPALKDKNAYQLYSIGDIAMAKGEYHLATESFENLEAQYPFSSYVEQAHLNLIYTHYKMREFPAASAAAERYIHLYPRSRNIDYAYYMKGVADFSQGRTFFQRFLPIDLSQRDLTQARKSFENFSILIARFPNSPYAADARQRMIYLRDLLAKNYLAVANFYMQRRAYVAVLNRTGYIVKHYQRAPQVEPALGLMVEAYHALSMDKEADDALRILKLNYPHSTVTKNLFKPKTRSWLERV